MHGLRAHFCVQWLISVGELAQMRSGIIPCEQIEHLLHQHQRNTEGIVVTEMNWSAGMGKLPPQKRFGCHTYCSVVTEMGTTSGDILLYKRVSFKQGGISTVRSAALDARILASFRRIV